MFGVYALGGAALLLGSRQLLEPVIASSDSRAFHAASIAVGAVLLAVALLLFRRRQAHAGVGMRAELLNPRSAFALGAVVTAIDLPTAFPYFAAITAITGSGEATGTQFGLLLTFNLIYVLPLAAILVATMAGGRRSPVLRRARNVVDASAPTLLAAPAAASGVLLLLRGSGGLLS